MAKIVRRTAGKAKAEVTEANKKTNATSLPSLDLDEISRVIRLRRSMSPPKYSGEPVRKEEVELLLENAHWAPNHGKTEPWHFIVFSGESLAELGKQHAELYKTHTPAESFQQEKYEKLMRRPTEASHVIAICMKRGSNPKIPEIEEIEAVACAVQNIYLTATALGLAGYWSSGGMTYHDSMREALGLGAEDRCLGFFFLGRPGGEWPEGKRRSTWQEKVEWRG